MYMYYIYINMEGEQPSGKEYLSGVVEVVEVVARVITAILSAPTSASSSTTVRESFFLGLVLSLPLSHVPLPQGLSLSLSLSLSLVPFRSLGTRDHSISLLPILPCMSPPPHKPN